MEEKCSERERPFICGVIEGFYGRPWTTDQRKDMFRKLKKWGMDSYVYAPKDDYKHRAFWRELYTVEESDHLTSLITAAKEQGIVFYYALSPGLDMTYSSQKELQTLKRKLDQVSQFGCEAFALLFDDIESELSKADKEVFQTFANAHVSVTNEIYTHLGTPKFLFCPTQYCSTRAVPTVHDSEYLNTLGSKLNHDIDIFWTGNKVISKTITLESIQEITEVLRRPPVIWDNLHANDYDQKRVFLGPYSGRSPELIPHLRGVMTNPNCEFHANTVAIHTLAYWSRCSMDSKVVDSTLSADIKLETENEDELPVECCLSKNIYHPRLALKSAIEEWLTEFFQAKEAWGPITKPQPQVQMVMPIPLPIIPSINTCMSLTTTTTTSTSTLATHVPEVNTTQLQALADVCSTVNSTTMPISNPVMNSLVSSTKVVTNEDIVNPIPTTVASTIELPKTVPISIVSVPIMDAKTIVTNEQDLAANAQSTPEVASDKEISKEITYDASSEEKTQPVVEAEESNEKRPLPAEDDDVVIEEKPTQTITSLSVDTINMLDENSMSSLSAGAINEPMECSSITSQISPKDEASKLTVAADDVVMASMNDLNSMHVESIASSPISTAEMQEEECLEKATSPNPTASICPEDLYLLCDLFYLPFEHGSRGLKLLNEFNWLKANATVLNIHDDNCDVKDASEDANKSTSNNPEVNEWLQRAENFSKSCNAVHVLLVKIACCENKEICHDLYSYVWDISGALELLNAYVKWLQLARFPHNMYSYTQGSYTWFSKGWKEAFMSGDQEPWVFRGGISADLQRLMPVDSGNDLFIYKLPEQPTTEYSILRPYNSVSDEEHVYKICTRSTLQLLSHDTDTLFELPSNVKNIIADSLVGPHLTMNPEFCIVAQNESNAIIGYAAAALDVNLFQRNLDLCWLPEMCEKYPKNIYDNMPGAGCSGESLLTTTHKMNAMVSLMIQRFHKPASDYPCPTVVSNSFPALLTLGAIDESSMLDSSIIKRLLTVLLAALRANGCFGIHVRLPGKDHEHAQFYAKYGFAEVYRDVVNDELYMARRF